MKKLNKGITLIALIITIIVLLILAGITIGMLTSNNSILNQSNNARKETLSSEEAEKVQFAINDAEINVSQSVSGELTTDAVNKGIKGQFGEDAEAEGDGPWTYTGKYNTYVIEKNGELVNLQSMHITNYNELKAFAERVNSGETFEKYIVYLDNDITMEDEEWIVIGTPGSRDEAPNTFNGIFEGNNHTIYNLKFVNYKRYMGLFCSNEGKIQNLRVNSNLTTRGEYIGLIAATNSGIVKNCIASIECNMNVSGSTLEMGGIAGSNAGTISNCKSTGNISITGCGFDTTLGGITGNNNSNISNCKNEVNISSDANDTGGICGKSVNGTIEKCINIGELTINGIYSGGIVGEISDVDIKQCANKGNIIIENNILRYAGGICGKTNGNNTISSCYFIGNVTNNAGGRYWYNWNLGVKFRIYINR